MNNNSLRICEHCKEEISYNARRCPYCGSLLGNPVQTGYYGQQGTAKQYENDSNTFSQDTVKPDNTDYNDYQNTNNNTNTNTSISTDTNINTDIQRISLDKPDLSKDNGQAYTEHNYQNNVPDNNEAHPVKTNDTGDSSGYKYYYSHINEMDSYDIRPLSNRTKVFLTTFSSFIPWLGQLVGIIAAIVYMNSEEDDDRRSFGRSLLVASLITFVIATFLILFTISAFINN
ncbi:hypothetical protein [Pseudobacteroides cellulosolvens]|uniref:Zinc-ribbon domain-containing protein n=1 Tax=Pseudobacteroides cellulosolvens ATCC 35603 = DSM 2933 TaxID=398512 RepID=A0A0L6JH61_9FIRM|nr:hypothetical protein [Pseudobacteroides cellulosolvens]KNY24802.1 hypothetical protein Bccel_0059 [Pseudobacteroides cellulosolvens ATCC 35603 = DSM 2933]